MCFCIRTIAQTIDMYTFSHRALVACFERATSLDLHHTPVRCACLPRLLLHNTCADNLLFCRVPVRLQYFLFCYLEYRDCDEKMSSDTVWHKEHCTMDIVSTRTGIPLWTSSVTTLCVSCHMESGKLWIVIHLTFYSEAVMLMQIYNDPH
jgi:hypothetical protein